MGRAIQTSLTFRSLQDRLRDLLLARIASGEITGLRLAELSGLRQAHISNFLNRRRRLSLEAMDAVLAVCRLSPLDLLSGAEINRRATVRPPAATGFVNLALVEPAIAAQEPFIRQQNVLGLHQYPTTFLRRLRRDMQSPRQEWERFVLVRASAHEGISMFPRFLPGALLLIDRQYNSLQPYRKHDRNMYAVRSGADGSCTISYVELSGSNLLLRPHNRDYPVIVLPLEQGRTYAEKIVGRICHVTMEA
ncbi:MAG TPA: LexA family transcriptional regulator [Terriglobales bacterium]|nr:LexA family transcriptional regulator [Terriglobales bacterium]